MNTALATPAIALISTIVSTAFGAWVVVWVRRRGEALDRRAEEERKRTAAIQASADAAVELREVEANQLRRDREELRSQMREELFNARQTITELQTQLRKLQREHDQCREKLMGMEKRIAGLERRG